MTNFLAYRIHKDINGIHCSMRQIGRLYDVDRYSDSFDPLGFEPLNENDLYIGCIYSPQCLQGKFYEKRFQREIPHYQEKGIETALLVRKGLILPQSLQGINRVEFEDLGDLERIINGEEEIKKAA